uniref:Uncharacterized protein n=1 Tax=Physcomitrium patens TaxID=3218 RepID=A0A2K1IHK4_PHYPA|nr:hypothetical protein PHYPA_029352 [Physcomitrium patens]
MNLTSAVSEVIWTRSVILSDAAITVSTHRAFKFPSCNQDCVSLPVSDQLNNSVTPNLAQHAHDHDDKTCAPTICIVFIHLTRLLCILFTVYVRPCGTTTHLHPLITTTFTQTNVSIVLKRNWHANGC